MSTIKEMYIRGIRSFGCEKEDEQKITFSSPLTLIVGQNGCGKTTIIECLKYALTGETPPGSSGGKTFVHDPKVFKSNSSLGQVRLQVSDIAGNKKTCVRSIKSDIQKNGKSRFTTLDSTIITDSVNGRREESGRRVEDANNEMAQSMGVSKAILNNVIFCHQEDSNWPLDEASKLKLKFDAIFGTTEYNKAIDRIIKHRKTYQEKLKICVQDKKHKEEINRDADRKMLEHDRLKTKHEVMKAKFDGLEAELVPVNEEIERLYMKEKKYSKLNAQKIIFESTIKNCATNIENTKEKIKTLLDGSVTEIEQQLISFKETQKANEEKLTTLKKECQDAVMEEKKYSASVLEAKSKMEQISTHMGNKQDLEAKLLKAVKKLSSDLNIPLEEDADTQLLTADDFTSSIDKIQQGIEGNEKALSDLKSKGDEKDRLCQREIDQTREKKTTIETNIKTQRNQLSKLNQDKQEMEKEISSIESSMPRFNQLIAQIASTEQELTKIKSSVNLEELEDQKTVIAVEKSEIEEKLAAVDAERETLQSISGVTTELNVKEKDLLGHKQDFDRFKNKNSSKLKELFPGKSIDRNYKNVVQELSDELKASVQRTKTDLQKAQMEKNRLHTERNHIQNQHKIKSDEINETKEKIERICDGKDFEDFRASQKEKVEKLHMDLAIFKSSDKLYKRYIDDIEQTPCCPLCHKNLESNESNDLQDEIKEQIRKLPSRIAETEKKLKQESKKFDELNGLQSAHENFGKLKKDVQQSQDNLKRVKEQYELVESSINDLEMLLLEPEEKLETISSTFFTDMCRLDELSRTIAAKSEEIRTLKSKLPDVMPSKTLEEVNNDFRQLNADLKSRNVLMNQLNDTTNENHKRINGIQDKLNNLVGQKMKQQEKFQGIELMKTQLKTFEEEILTLKRKINEEEKKLEPTIKELEKLVRDKQIVKDELNNQVQDRISIIEDFKRRQDEIQRFNKDIKTYEKMQLDKKFSEAQEKIAKGNTRIKQIGDEIRKTSKVLDQLKDEISNQETYKRNLQDNIELHKIQMEKRTAEEGFAKLKQEVGDLNPEKLMKDRKIFHDKRDKLTEERQTIRGSMTESENRIEAAATELNDPRYKKAKQNYLNECNKEAVLNAMIKDLHKYRAVLERSLLKYHGDKMLEINQTIRELWNNIYSGNDIDYIMIKTDEDAITTTVSDKKRSYNYRVVQAKSGGAEIDMRGRCSAGQKVLASLIIRMALADTFSANCGILALDEPTTNLDQTNIDSLCAALTRIVEEREKTGNFMLLVITHDISFVTAMERAEHYFKLSRDHVGRSRIDKVENYR